MVLRQVGPASAGKATRWTRCGVHYVEPIEGQLRGWGTRPEFEPSSLALLECNALWRPARPGLQSRGHDSEKLEVPRCEMRQKRQRHFAFVLLLLVDMAPTLKFAGTWRLARRQSCVLPSPCWHPPPQISYGPYLRLSSEWPVVDPGADIEGAEIRHCSSPAVPLETEQYELRLLLVGRMHGHGARPRRILLPESLPRYRDFRRELESADAPRRNRRAY
jgi:hypothetical protein